LTEAEGNGLLPVSSQSDTYQEVIVIPPLADGVLPEGLHLCTIDEIDEVFGGFQRTDCRIRLTQKLRLLVEEAKRSGIVAALVIDGSYVTRKNEPGDIDVIVALRPDIYLAPPLRPFEYDMQSKRRLKEKYRFDFRVVADGSIGYNEAVEFFGRVRRDDPEQTTSQARKGLLRIEL
jgi:hypothetical protein